MSRLAKYSTVYIVKSRKIFSSPFSNNVICGWNGFAVFIQFLRLQKQVFEKSTIYYKIFCTNFRQLFLGLKRLFIKTHHTGLLYLISHEHVFVFPFVPISINLKHVLLCESQGPDNVNKMEEARLFQ